MKKFIKLIKAIHSVNMEILRNVMFSVMVSVGIPLAIVAWFWFCDSLIPKIGAIWAIVLALIWVEIPMLIMIILYILDLISKYCSMVHNKLGEEE